MRSGNAVVQRHLAENSFPVCLDGSASLVVNFSCSNM
jgi:hypothetical protein